MIFVGSVEGENSGVLPNILSMTTSGLDAPIYYLSLFLTQDSFLYPTASPKLSSELKVMNATTGVVMYSNYFLSLVIYASF